MRKQRWQYVKKSQAVGYAPDPRLMHLLSGHSESHVDLSGAVATLEKIVSLDYYLRSPISQVVHLALDDTSLGDLELQVLADALTATNVRAPASLRSLSLCRNRLTADGAAHVARVWLAHGTTLLALHLSGNERVGAGNGATALAETAHRIGPARCALRRLALGACGVDNKGAIALARVFARQAAKADANSLASDQAVLEASGAVSSGSASTLYRLTAVELADNLLDDSVVKDIGQLCKKNTCVEALVLSGNAITDTGAAQLLKQLVGCRAVRLLDLSRNPIKYGVAVRQALSELHLSPANTALRTIDLSSV
jgi:Ran GTPase-activating protein (RanGAP) involved in mRNA processing and transport